MDSLARRAADASARLVPTVDRALAASVTSARAALDPDFARDLERELAYRKNYGRKRDRDGRASGWRKGQPQCPSCRRILNRRDGWCPNCRTLAGRHDHGR